MSHSLNSLKGNSGESNGQENQKFNEITVEVYKDWEIRGSFLVFQNDSKEYSIL